MEAPAVSDRHGRLGVELAEIAVGGVESRATTPGTARRTSGATLVAVSSPRAGSSQSEGQGRATSLLATPSDSSRQPSHSPEEPASNAVDVVEAQAHDAVSEPHHDSHSPPPPLQSPEKVFRPLGDGSTSGGRTPPLTPVTAADPGSPSPIPLVEKPSQTTDLEAACLEVPFPPVKEADECPICLETFSDDNPAVANLCGHRFHLACQLSWHQRSNVCPMCLSVPPGSEPPAFGEIADEVDPTPHRPDPDEAIREHLFALLVASMVDDPHPHVGLEAGHHRLGRTSHARSRSPSTHSLERGSAPRVASNGTRGSPQQPPRREVGADASELDTAYSSNSFSSEESSNIRRHSQNLTRLVRERSNSPPPAATRKSGWRRFLCCCDD